MSKIKIYKEKISTIAIPTLESTTKYLNESVERLNTIDIPSFTHSAYLTNLKITLSNTSKDVKNLTEWLDKSTNELNNIIMNNINKYEFFQPNVVKPKEGKINKI